MTIPNSHKTNALFFILPHNNLTLNLKINVK